MTLIFNFYGMRKKIGLISILLVSIFIFLIFIPKIRINENKLIIKKYKASFSNTKKTITIQKYLSTKIYDKVTYLTTKKVSEIYNLVDFDMNKDLIVFLHIPKTGMLLFLTIVENLFLTIIKKN